MDKRYDDDPMCFVKMLHDFRTDSIPGRRMSALGFPGLGGSDPENAKTVAKPVKLDFDDSFLNETVVKADIKKRKIDNTPDSQKLYDSFSITSPWESRKLKVDLVEARSEICRLESRINQMETVHKETLVLYEQERHSLQQSLEKERNSSSELEQRLRTLRKREAEMRQELLECQGSVKQDKLNIEKKYQTLFQEHVVLKDKFAELDTDSGDKVIQLERKLAAALQQISDVQEELAENKQVVNSLREEVNEKRSESRLWEADKAKLSTLNQRVQELEYEKESHQKAITKAKTQQSKLLRLYDLEKEVTSLKEENKNLRQAITDKLLLESKVADLRSRLSVLEEREQEIVSLKVEVGVAQTRLQEWAELSKQILGQGASSNSPISLRQCLERLQKSELLLISENTQLKSKLKNLEEAQKESAAECESLRSQMTKLKATIDQNTAVINRLRKQNSLIVWERNDLRQLVDSCQKEFTMTSSAPLDMQHISRIEALEKVLDGYRKRNEELEADPSIVLGAGNMNAGNIDLAELAKLKTERETLIKEKAELMKKIEELQHQMDYRALKGDFDVRQTKILHFRSNPTSEATSSHASEIEKYQTEIARLRERIQVLQEGKTHDVTQIVNERVDIKTGKEIEELKDKLNSQERQNQRLREAFKTTSREFREAVNTLLGYKVDALPNKNYRLSSLYAETPDQYLLFKMLQNGVMDLLETPYSETVSDLIDIHLHQEHSIPVFLAAITMELFQKQIMCSSVVPQDDDDDEDEAEIILSD